MTQSQLDRTGFPPSAYLIGAQKAGTTSLADVLSTHPRLALSRPKEPDFFTGNWDKGLEWYRSRFADACDKVLLDASTSYSMAPTSPAESKMNDVPRRIFELRPDARFLYLVRDPVDRAVSAYWHAVRNGDEKRSMEACMTEDSIYIRASRYSFQLEHYLEYFARDRFLILATSRLAADSNAVAAQCWSFLGLEASDAPMSSVGRRNEGYVVTGVPAGVLALPGGKRAAKYVWKLLRRTLPEGALKAIKSTVSDRPPETPAGVREALERALGDERRRLEILAGVEIG